MYLYQNLLCMSKEESLEIIYTVEVLNYLVYVSTNGTFCWVRIFENHVGFIFRHQHILKAMDLLPHEVVMPRFLPHLH